MRSPFRFWARAGFGLRGAALQEREAALAHTLAMFDQASAAARIGLWECSLPDETLRWANGTYDLFELPRGCRTERSQILRCYTRESREELEDTRRRALEQRSGFQLDAEIVTPRQTRRWIRLTASVESYEGRPIRLFGIKQDITEEKLLWRRTQYLAEFDALTGLANRSQFQAKLAAMVQGRGPGRDGALLLVDLDGFKEINDGFGHAVGDECLRQAALRISEVCREADLVARIGGDEFAVLVGGRRNRSAAKLLAGRIVDALSRPFTAAGQSARIGASVGLAWIEDCPEEELFRRADAALYAAKSAGRNTFRLFQPGVTPDLLGPASRRLNSAGERDARGAALRRA